MELSQLKALAVVAEVRSISRAARELRVTQPALSVRLKALEQEVGAPLLARSYDGVSLTPQGEVAVATARRVLELIETMVRAVKAAADRPELFIGATPTLGGYVLPHVLSRFIALHPEVRVSMTVSHRSGVTQQVADGRLTVGFVEDTAAVPDLRAEAVGQDELQLVASARWPDQGTLTEAGALALPQVLCIQDCGMRQVLDRYLHSRGMRAADLAVVAELDSLDAVKALVEGGAGVAWLSPRAVRRELQAGTLRLWPVNGVQIPFRYVALFRESRELCQWAQSYIHLVRERLRPHRRRAGGYGV